MTEQPDTHQPVLAIMHQNMVTLHEQYTVQQALDFIRQHGFGEKIAYFYVVSEDRQLKGVILTRGLLTAPLEKLTELISGQVATAEVAQIIDGIKPRIADVNFFLDDVLIAVEDITQRLTEIREQYWNLNLVPDGQGGIIYQRATKGRLR